VQALGESNLSNKVKDNEKFARMKLDMIKSHIEYVTLHLFRTHVETSSFKDARIKGLLMECFRINAIKSLIDNCGAVYESQFFAPSAFNLMKQALDQLIEKIRPQLIPLVESYPLGDTPSNIGNYYGDIYEQQMEQARDSGLNKLDIGGVPPQWESYIKPFLHENVQPKAKL
jgi:hypothetical protein